MKLKNARKLTVTFIVTMAFLLSAAFTFAAEWGAGTTVYQNIMDLGNGFTYTNTISNNPSYGREESYQMQTTPGSLVKPIVIACDTIYGSLNIQSVVNYAATLGYNVVGAINSDFFSMSTGVPMGIVVENGVYKASPEGYPSVCFDAAGNAQILDYTAVQIKLTNDGGAVVPEGGESNYGKNLTLTHLNKLRQNGAGMYLLDEYFSTVSTRTSSAGWIVKFKVLEGQMKTSGTMKLEVAETAENTTSMPIESGYMYLTADNTSGLGYQYQKFAVGDMVTLETYCYDNAALANCQWATGGGSVIIKNGAVTSSSDWDSALLSKNPRTALGIKADGSIVYYTLDGRQSNYSYGITMQQLANELMAQGCINAINFDGGGSTAIMSKLPGFTQAEVINSPSEGALRKCATYVLLVAESMSDGIAQRIHIIQDGAIVYQGATVDLTYRSTDSGYSTVAAPADVTAAVTSGHGSVTGNVYTAGWTEGSDTITLQSASTGLTGTGHIYVVNKLSSFTVKAGGKEVSSMRVERGQTVQFAQTATYYGEAVTMGQNNYQYTVSDGLGTISDTGLLTVSEDAPSGSGWVNIKSGGISKTIWISVGATFSDVSGHWAEDYINEMYKKCIVTGNSDGTFGPNNNIKRCDFILMLYRAAGQPTASADSGFADVASDAYYASAVGWAKQAGIAQGDGTNFSPSSNMTREDAFTFIYRYLQQQGINVSDADESVLAAFTDSSSIANYAKNATAVLVKLGVVNGANGKIQPVGKLTRAEMAKILSTALALNTGADSQQPADTDVSEEPAQGTDAAESSQTSGTSGENSQGDTASGGSQTTGASGETAQDADKASDSTQTSDTADSSVSDKPSDTDDAASAVTDNADAAA